MKIAIFHNVPSGGAKRVVYEEVRSLTRRHTVDLYELSSTDENYLDIKPLVHKVVTYDFRLKEHSSIFVSRLYRDFQNFILLANIHKKMSGDIIKEGYDVVLVHPDKYTQAPYLLRYLKVPNIYFCEELLRLVYEKELAFNENVIFIKRWYESMTRLIRKNIDKLNAKSSTRILVSSKYIKKKVSNVYGKSAKICHLGVDCEVFSPKKEVNLKKILFIGEKSLINGYNIAKRAIELLSSKLKLNLKVISFTSNSKPRLTDIQMSKEYSSAFLTLCVSQNEPFGLVPLESMACETPVLALNSGGYRETVLDGVTGYLLPGSPEEFAKKIEYLYRHPKVFKKMGKDGRKHVKKNYAWDKHGKILEEDLYELCKK